MAAPIIGRRPRWAPGPSARLNQSHPLATGLVGLGIGPRRLDRKVTPTAPTVARAVEPTPYGMGLGSRAADTDGFYGFSTSLATTPQRMTLAAFVNVPNTTGNGPAAGGAICLGPAANGLLLGVGGQNSPGPNLYCLDSGVAHHVTTTVVAGTGWRCIAVSANSGGGAGSMLIHLDALMVSSQSANHAMNASPIIRIGAESSSGRGFEGQIGPWAAWSRVLSGPEIAAFYADPFQMLDF